MPDTVAVTIEVDARAALAMADARTRAAMGRLVSRVLIPRRGPSAVALAIAEAKAEARAAGLTDTEIDAELAAYNAERRNEPCLVRVWHEDEAPTPCTGWARGVGDRNEPRV